MTAGRFRCLYRAASGALAEIDDARLAATTERHKLQVAAGGFVDGGSPLDALDRDAALAGVVCQLHVGWAGREVLRLVGQVLRRGRRAWLYWPGEGAIEAIDRERLASLWRHWVVIQIYRRAWKPVRRIVRHLRHDVGFRRMPQWLAARVLR